MAGVGESLPQPRLTPPISATITASSAGPKPGSAACLVCSGVPATPTLAAPSTRVSGASSAERGHVSRMRLRQRKAASASVPPLRKMSVRVTGMRSLASTVRMYQGSPRLLRPSGALAIVRRHRCQLSGSQEVDSGTSPEGQKAGRLGRRPWPFIIRVASSLLPPPPRGSGISPRQHLRALRQLHHHNRIPTATASPTCLRRWR